MADIWGTVNYAEADSFSCTEPVASIAQVQSDQPMSETLYPVNGKDVLIAMAQAGQIIHEYQLERLSAEEKQEVLDALARLNKTLDTIWPGEAVNRY